MEAQMEGRPLGSGGDDDGKPFEPKMLEVLRLDFIYQVVWQENMLSERLEVREKAAEEAAKEAGSDTVAMAQ